MYYENKIKAAEKKVVCGKCGDKYHPTYGGLSVRKSCRYHNIDKHGFCKDCNILEPHRNCYHIRKKEKKFFCIIT